MNSVVSAIHESIRPSAPRVREGAFPVEVTPWWGGPPATVEARWRLSGVDDAPVVAVLGGLSSNRQADGSQGWWPAQIGPGRALDTNELAVLGIDFLGERPSGWRGVDVRDQAQLLGGVLDGLGIDRLQAVVGASYGGAVALAFAERQAQRCGRALVLSAAHRPDPMATALRCLQRRWLEQAAGGDGRAEATSLARALAMTTYRSAADFRHRFDAPAVHDGGRWRFPVEDYLLARGRDFARRFDAARYHVLSESMDLCRIDPGLLEVDLRLLAVVEDRLVPLEQVRELARATRARLSVVESRYGHDAFLAEHGLVEAWLQQQLQDEGRMRGPSGPN